MEQYLSNTLSIAAVLAAFGTLVTMWIKHSNVVAVMKAEDKHFADRIERLEKKMESLYESFHKTEESLAQIENKLENVLEFMKDIKNQNERLIRLETKFENGK